MVQWVKKRGRKRRFKIYPFALKDWLKLSITKTIESKVGYFQTTDISKYYPTRIFRFPAPSGFEFPARVKLGLWLQACWAFEICNEAMCYGQTKSNICNGA